MRGADNHIPHEFDSLWAQAEGIWTEHENEPAFEGYVSADYRSVYRYLKRYRQRYSTFLEWGSGLGVVTIMAAGLGYEAYGLEIEPSLVEYANELASQHLSTATFALGSFIPEAYCTNMQAGEEFQRTISDAASGYDELDLELRDIDLVYAYPWPEEHALFRRIFRQYGSPTGTLLCFDQREGISVTTRNKRGRC